MKNSCLFALLFIALSTMAPLRAFAGVFDLPSFIEEGQWSVGAEAEAAVSGGTGLGVNFKPRYGVNDLLDIQGLIGTGTGARKFRIGFTADFEWFPDYESQPGLATPLFIEYYRIDEDGLLSFGAKPMIYKTFQADGSEFTPFVALPVGWNLRNSNAPLFVQMALGSLFKPHGTDHFKFSFEGGFDIKDSYSYISGGVTYFH
jgi:hypothetical protein